MRLLYLPCLQIHQLLSDAPGRAQSRIIEPFIHTPAPAHPTSKAVTKHVDDNSATIDSGASSETESGDEEGNRSDNELIGDANSNILP